MRKKILEKIIKCQLSDKNKQEKASFIINTMNSKYNCFKKILKIIQKIKEKQNA